MNTIAQSPAMQEANSWFAVVTCLPDGDQRFQHELMSVQVDNVDPLRAISLAYAALLVANANEANLFASWYRDKAMMLLVCASMVMAAMADKAGEPVN